MTQAQTTYKFITNSYLSILENLTFEECQKLSAIVKKSSKGIDLSTRQGVKDYNRFKIVLEKVASRIDVILKQGKPIEAGLHTVEKVD